MKTLTSLLKLAHDSDIWTYTAVRVSLLPGPHGQYPKDTLRRILHAPETVVDKYWESDGAQMLEDWLIRSIDERWEQHGGHVVINLVTGEYELAKDIVGA
jgi:hypothetical protein